MWKISLLLSILCPLVNCICNGCTEYRPVRVDDPGLKAVVNHIIGEMSKTNPQRYHHKVDKIIDAEQSICSIKKLCGESASYQINAMVGLTNCLKNEVRYENIDDCELQQNFRPFHCTIRASKSRDGKYERIDINCR